MLTFVGHKGNTMVVIRLSRGGTNKRPFYHIMVTDRRNARDGRFIEKIGYFNPIATGKEVPFLIELERYQYWIQKGAQPSDRVSQLVKAHLKQDSKQAA